MSPSVFNRRQVSLPQILRIRLEVTDRNELVDEFRIGTLGAAAQCQPDMSIQRHEEFLITMHRSYAALALSAFAHFALVVCLTAASMSEARASDWVAGWVSMSPASYAVTVPPTAGSVTLTAVRNGGTTGAISVTYKTVGETAVAGVQFTPTTGTLNWASGDSSSKTFTIPILKSSITSSKYFFVRLTAGAGSALGSHAGSQINIVPGSNGNTSAGTVSMSAATYTVDQPKGSITLTAERSGGTNGAVSVTYATVGGTAVAGTQFTASEGTLSWANGDGANKTFTIPISTTPFTGTKDFAVQLTAAAGTVLGSPSSATVNIVGSSTEVTKSVKAWVSCIENQDETVQLEQAIFSAANNAFILLIDCPVRFHTGNAPTIAVPNGVTIEFEGAGEFLLHGTALTVANPSEVTFIDYTVTRL